MTCDCCKAEGRNSEYMNGNTKLCRAKLFKVYMGRTATVKLCRLCDIELFRVGESRFLQNHIGFTKELSVNQKNFT